MIRIDARGWFRGDIANTRRIQKHIEKALEYTRKWRATANVNKCAYLYVMKIMTR